MAEARGGRRREYASDADRVRAWRERRKNQARLAQQQAATPTDPAEAIATLADAVPLLRREAREALERFAEVARTITVATELVADPAAIDAHLRRVQADADKVRADAAAEIADLREQLDTAVEDRADADAAAAAAEDAAAAAAETLEVARREHTAERGRWQQQCDTAERDHARQVADLERHIGELTAQVEQHTEQMTVLRSEADNAAAVAAATVARLDSDLAAARAESRTERERAETSRGDAAVDRAHLEAARARVDELRAELRELRELRSSTR